MKRGTVLARLAAGSVLAPVAVRAQPLRPLAITHTAQTANDWPLYVADQLGFWRAAGLDVQLYLPGSNAAATQQLAASSVEMAGVSGTQLIEAIDGGAPIVAICAQYAAAPYSIVARKGITSFAQLKGKNILVGGPNDITRVFMDAVLAKHGLRPDDYTYTFAGTTGDRYAGLVAGAIDATILNPPFAFRAADDGFPVLDEVAKYFPGFVQGFWSIRPEWARANTPLLLDVLVTYLRAVRWMYDPKNKDRAVAILVDVTHAKREEAVRTYDFYVGRLKFFPTTGRITDAAIAAVQDALVKTNVIKPPLSPPSKYYDNRYDDLAVAQLRRRPA
jgi:ABC-type nitrate/sulfonate/bicarbonate transport system substrate-binding protein